MSHWNQTENSKTAVPVSMSKTRDPDHKIALRYGWIVSANDLWLLLLQEHVEISHPQFKFYKPKLVIKTDYSSCKTIITTALLGLRSIRLLIHYNTTSFCPKKLSNRIVFSINSRLGVVRHPARSINKNTNCFYVRVFFARIKPVLSIGRHRN